MSSLFDLLIIVGVLLAFCFLIWTNPHSQCFNVHGNSMEPLIMDGQLIVADLNFNKSALTIGDVVVYRNNDLPDGNNLVIHEIIARNNDVLITKGTNWPTPDAQITVSDVLGVWNRKSGYKCGQLYV